MKNEWMLYTLSKNQWKVTGYPVTQVTLENSVEYHWKFSEIPLETSENLLETSENILKTSENLLETNENLLETS